MLSTAATEMMLGRSHDPGSDVVWVDLPPVVVPAVDDGHDVRVRQPRDRPRLAAEALEVLGVGGVVLVKDLDRDAPFELAVVRPEDGRHAAGSHELLELVSVGDQLAWLRRP